MFCFSHHLKIITRTRTHTEKFVQITKEKANETSDRSSALRERVLFQDISTTTSIHTVDFFLFFPSSWFWSMRRDKCQKERENKEIDKHCTNWANKNERETDLFIIIVVQLSVGDKPIVNLHCMNISKQRRGSTWLRERDRYIYTLDEDAEYSETEEEENFNRQKFLDLF